MPEIKFPSEWLKINDNVEHGDRIKFIDAGKLDTDSERYEFVVGIIRKGKLVENKKFTLNKTNFTVISELYGTNSDAWVGKEMTVNTIKVRNPQTGKLVDSIALVPPSEIEIAKGDLPA